MERTRKQETQTLKQSLFPLLALALFGVGTFDLFKQQDRQTLFQAVQRGRKPIYQCQQFATYCLQALGGPLGYL